MHAVASELVSDLACSIHTEIIFPYPTKFIAKPSVFCASYMRMFLSGQISVIDRWRNRQTPVDWSAIICLLAFLNGAPYDLKRRPSYPSAEHVNVLRWISLPRRSSQILHSSAWFSSDCAGQSPEADWSVYADVSILIAYQVQIQLWNDDYNRRLVRRMLLLFLQNHASHMFTKASRKRFDLLLSLISGGVLSPQNSGKFSFDCYESGKRQM